MYMMDGHLFQYKFTTPEFRSKDRPGPTGTGTRLVQTTVVRPDITLYANLVHPAMLSPGFLVMYTS